MFSVEYLFLFKKDAKIDASHERILYNLKGNKNIIFDNDSSLEFDGMKISLSINEVRREENVPHKSCNFIFKHEHESENINGAIAFLSFVTEVTATLQELNNEGIKILENSAAAFLARESYKLINNIENKMRKLITLFMTSNVGADWEKSNIPDVVEGSVKDKQKLSEDKTSNILYYVNFIDLSVFLFKGYKTMDTDELHRRLSKGDIELEEITRRYNPKSNWERYFQNHLEVQDKFITDKWSELYELRNKVAHNRSISGEEYYKIKGISKNLEGIIEKAVKKVNEIVLTDEQIEEVTLVANEEIKHAQLSTLVSDLKSGQVTLSFDKSNRVVYSPGWINDLTFISDLDSSEASLVMSNITNGLDIKDFDVKISSSPEPDSHSELTFGKIITSKNNNTRS